MLIVIEGACDGIGKTTQYNLLKERLINDGYDVVTHHFPSYGMKQAKGVEDYLSGKYGNPFMLDPFFVNGLYAYDRKVTWENLLKDKYNSDAIILLDRYVTSSLIYQSSVIENKQDKIDFINKVCELEYLKNEIAKPDIVIFLTAPYDLVKSMRNNRQLNDGIKNDIHESNDAYMKKVYNNALFVAQYLKFNQVNCIDNGKMRSVSDISDEIYKLVRKRL